MSRHEFVLDGEPVETSVERIADRFNVTVGEKTVVLTSAGAGMYIAETDGVRSTVAAAFHKGICYIDIDSVLIELREPTDDGYGGGGGDQSAVKDKIFAPMPGKIVKIMVQVGDAVTEKQPLVIVEAMKMENSVLCRANGTVKAVNFSAGDQVDTETPIIELEINDA
jgi:biotin carboxyl carrier protein